MTVEGWSLVFLGVMAAALVVMAVVLTMTAVQAARLSKQASETTAALQRDLRPLIEKVDRISTDLARVSQTAVVQAERVDRLMASTVDRIDETLELFQTSVAQPIRQGAAIMAAVRAAVGVFRSVKEHQRQLQDEEEALFVG